MGRRQRGLGRCSMLPISAGLPLILSGEKRPPGRRSEPGARPRGGSAAAGFAGLAAADPALPAARAWPQAPPAPPGKVSGPQAAEPGGKGRGREAHGLSPLNGVSPPLRAPRTPVSHPKNRAETRPRGPKAGAGPRVRPCHVAAPGARPPRPCFQSAAQCLLPMKPKPQERENWFGDEA